MTTSDDFYVTLPSDASTDEFQANAPNHFTVRLPRPLHLSGEGWKVGLSSLSLPDTRANLYRLVPKQQYLFSLKWFVLRNGKRTRRRTTVQMDDIDHLDSVSDGEHFMRAIIQHLEGQRRRGRHGDLFVNDQASHWYVKWDWEFGICGARCGCLHQFESQLFYHEAASEETEWHQYRRR